MGSQHKVREGVSLEECGWTMRWENGQMRLREVLGRINGMDGYMGHDNGEGGMMLRKANRGQELQRNLPHFTRTKA